MGKTGMSGENISKGFGGYKTCTQITLSNFHPILRGLTIPFFCIWFEHIHTAFTDRGMCVMLLAPY